MNTAVIMVVQKKIFYDPRENSENMITKYLSTLQDETICRFICLQKQLMIFLDYLVVLIKTILIKLMRYAIF